MKIALFPGCFDPFHNQHAAIVKSLTQAFQFDQIWILINQNSEEKTIIAQFQDRYQIIKQLFQKYPEIHVINKPISFYTTEMIKEFQKIYPDDQFYLILGSDQINKLEQWQNADNLPNLIRFICAMRKDHPLNPKIEQKYQILTIPNLKINDHNSTAIKKGRNWFFLNKCTQKYILDHKLYLDNILNEQIEDKKRIQHCYNVAHLTQQIAQHFNYNGDWKALFFAGLFHDITKTWTKEKHLSLLKKHKLSLDALLDLPEPIQHAYTGAYFVYNELNMKNNEVFLAIKYHSTAKKGFSDFGKIVFIADKLESSKEKHFFLSAKKTSKNSKIDLEELFAITLKNSFQKLQKQNKKPTRDHYDAYLQYC